MTDLPARRAQTGETLPRLEIEIRPETPGQPNGSWRVYTTDPRNRKAALRRGGYVLGGSMRQAYQDAEALEADGDFFFKRPADAPHAPVLDGTSALKRAPDLILPWKGLQS